MVPVPGKLVDTEQVLADAGRTLPTYMVPSVLVVMDALPLNANGKLDRRALPEPEYRLRAYSAPQTYAERIVAEAFEAVLHVERVGRTDDFFEPRR